MEKGTFSDENIINLINAYFVPIKINTRSSDVYHTEKGDFSAGQLARSFGIRGVPATFFLTPEGSIITNIPGYLPADRFSLVLRFIGEDHYKNQTFSEFLKSLEKEK